MRTLSVGLLVGALSAFGCTAELDSVSGTDAEVETTSEEIITTTVGGGAGAVLLWFSDGSSCTGVAISQFVVLTAAHCYDGPMGTALDGSVPTKIFYTKDGLSYRCVNGASKPPPDSWDCADYRTTVVSRYRRTDTGTDFAAVLIPGAGLSSWVDRMDLTPAAFESLAYRFYGQGHNSTNGTGIGTHAPSRRLDFLGRIHSLLHRLTPISRLPRRLRGAVPTKQRDCARTLAWRLERRHVRRQGRAPPCQEDHDQ